MLCCASVTGLHKIKLWVDCKARKPHSYEAIEAANMSIAHFNYKGAWKDHSSFSVWFNNFVLQIRGLLGLACQKRLYCCYIMYQCIQMKVADFENICYLMWLLDSATGLGSNYHRKGTTGLSLLQKKKKRFWQKFSYLNTICVWDVILLECGKANCP